MIWLTIGLLIGFIAGMEIKSGAEDAMRVPLAGERHYANRETMR